MIHLGDIVMLRFLELVESWEVGGYTCTLHWAIVRCFFISYKCTHSQELNCDKCSVIINRCKALSRKD